MDAPRIEALNDRSASALDRMARGWRGPAAAALIAFAAGAPGLFALPPLDRDESRFAQATAQMLETGDLVNIRFQDAPRDKKPVGIHWLQAASTALTSSVERRDIYPYRLPSLFGAMLAAAALAWGAGMTLGAGRGLLAGGLLGVTLLLSTEAFIGKTDAVLCGAVTLSMAALLRLYAQAKGLGQAGRSARTWMRRLGWVWGLVAILALAGPWAVAITVASDGGFWSSAVGGDLAPKLAGGHESHGAPPGLHLLLSPLLLFPASLLLPAALIAGWRARAEPTARFALAWLVPTWLVFEALPTKLPHYPLPTYPAIALLMALAVGVAPSLKPLWVSQRAAELLVQADLDPRNGVTIGPVTVAGYAEPSLVFALGTETELGDGADAAQALAEGRPALVESRQDQAFRDTIAKAGTQAVVAGRVRGFDYSVGREVVLTLWRNPRPPPILPALLAPPVAPSLAVPLITEAGPKAARPTRAAPRPLKGLQD